MKHTALTITPEQRLNLETLADVLASRERMVALAHAGDLVGFNMAVFEMHYAQDRTTTVIMPDADPCGSVACACGWGPVATGQVKTRDESWTEYADRVFGAPYEDYNEGTGLHSWLFGGGWVAHDNTPEGASARIRYALANGVPRVTDLYDPSIYNGSTSQVEA